jgi:predicted nucleic acid-binding protein
MAQIAVVDSSVVLKWFFEDEEYIGQAQLLIDACYLYGTIALFAPELMIYEALNATVTAVRRKRIPVNEAFDILNDMMEIGVELNKPEPKRVLELSLEYKIAAYDAAYLALAESLDCDLWTGDRAFYNAVKNELPYVKWIGNYASLS